MPTYRLALTLNDSRLLDDALQEQTAMYTVAALFTVTAVAAFALLVGYFVRRQLTLARLKNDLVAVVAHELRTPLASSRLLVDTLLEGDPDQNQQQEYLRMIASENERLTRLVENFLSFSRIQSGRNQFVFRVVSPSNIATRAVEVVSPTMGASGRQFRSEIEDDLPSIRVDADAVVTALTNLLENAIKFSAEDGQITMRVRSLDDAIVFEVQDDGIGMSTGDSSRAFDKFFQADRELSRNHGGCGLGLSLVRSIVHSHGGTVRVESELNQGSLFRVLLPIANLDSGNQKEQVA